MSIELTTPAIGGVITDGETFTHMRIAHWSDDPRRRQLSLVLVYGNKVGGKFKQSANPHMQRQVVIQKDDYTDLVSNATATAGQNLFRGARRAAYQWLMDNGYGAGTIDQS